MMLNGIVKEMTNNIEGIFHRQDKLVLHEDMVPPRDTESDGALTLDAGAAGDSFAYDSAKCDGGVY